jgi:hypothetical protein
MPLPNLNLIRKVFTTCVVCMISFQSWSQYISQTYYGHGHVQPSETPATQLYGGFVINDATHYPASHGSLFGYTHSSNGYGYSYQIFKGHTEPQLNVRFGNFTAPGNQWYSWKKLFDSGNDLAYEGSSSDSKILGYTHIYGRSGDGILHLHGGTAAGPVFVNYYETGNVILAYGGGSVGIGMHPSADGRLHVAGRIIGQNDGVYASGDKGSIIMSAHTGYYNKPTLHSITSGGVVNDLLINPAGGNVGIGTTTPDQKLTVKGIIHTEEVRVDMTFPGPDYVFESTYNLLPLSEVESYIKVNKHLPEVPSAKQMEEEGLNLKEMNLLLLKKVEELTLHLIEANRKIEQVSREIEVIKKK